MPRAVHMHREMGVDLEIGSVIYFFLGLGGVWGKGRGGGCFFFCVRRFVTVRRTVCMYVRVE